MSTSLGSCLYATITDILFSIQTDKIVLGLCITIFITEIAAYWEWEDKITALKLSDHFF